MGKNLSCCFTGYRPEKFGFELSPENALYNKFTSKLYEKIVDIAETGVTTFFSGMAMGFDILAAEAVLDVIKLRGDLGIRLVACVPYADQAKAFPPEWKERYDRILSECDEVVLLSERYFRGCYQARNRYMVDHTDFVITYYDGSPGGTKDTVKYAEKTGKGILNCYENMGEQLKIL